MDFLEISQKIKRELHKGSYNLKKHFGIRCSQRISEKEILKIINNSDFKGFLSQSTDKYKITYEFSDKYDLVIIVYCKFGNKKKITRLNLITAVLIKSKNSINEQKEIDFNEKSKIFSKNI